MSTAVLDLAYKETGAELSIIPAAIAEKEKALAALAQITSIDNPVSQEAAVNLIAIAAGLEKRMEASRQAVKAPVLVLERKIDATAKEFVTGIAMEKDRVLKLVNTFNAKERERAETARRQAEAEERKRIAEAEAQRRKEAEEAAENERQRQAEVARIQREQREREEASRDTSPFDESGKEDPALAAMRRAAEEDELKELQAEQEADRQREETERLARESARTTTVAPLVTAPAKVGGMSVRKNPRFEVLDAAAVFAARPDLCKLEVLSSQVTARMRDGMTECPGLRLFWEEDTVVRAK